MAKTVSGRRATPDLFAAQPTAPAGFRYQSDFISSAEEYLLVQIFQDLPFRNFEFFGHKCNRRVVSFGRRYDYSDGKLHDAAALPDWLVPFRERAAAFSELAPEKLSQAMVTEYTPGAGLGWHRDRPVYEDVVGISLVSPCTLRLRRERDKGWERRAVELEARSAYLFRGEVRDGWEHSITPMEVLRYSITFRSLRARS